MEMRMRASREHVPALRALAGERAMRADHDLDFIDDLRLAIDEVCAIMMGSCTPSDVLTVRLRIAPRHVEILASVPLRAPEEPVADGMSLRVLEALADSLDYAVDDTDGERVFRLDFCRDRPS
jgi:serine/threonine-protein kinase RsbW